MRSLRVNVAVLSLACLATVLSAGVAFGVSDPIPFTPYGMDAVPAAAFSTTSWDHYGSDPVPGGFTSDQQFRDVYGLDGIPEAIIPQANQHLRQMLPHHFLQVLTGDESN